MTPDVSVSIVTFDNESCVAPLLQQLETEKDVAWEALVFDNASSDRTREILDASPCIDLISSDVNVGYSRAHNVNLARSKGRYILLLNPDVRFSPGTLSSLAAYLDSNPDKAMVSPAILEGNEKKPFPPRRFYPGEGMIALEPGIRRTEIAWLNGCCILARAEVLRELNGFDEDFFLYQAETDLCLRARRRGFKLGWSGEVVVHHLHRQSQRQISEYEYSRRVFQGSAVFWNKHYPKEEVLEMAQFQLTASKLLLAAGKPVEKLGILPPKLRQERLKARRDVCRDLVASLKSQNPRTRRAGGILSRQSRLLREWLRQGQFPLDDY